MRISLAIPTTTSIIEVILRAALLVWLVIPVAEVTLWRRWAAVVLWTIAASDRWNIYINVYFLRLFIEAPTCVTCRGTAEGHHR